jgi:hypothetical protein
MIDSYIKDFTKAVLLLIQCLFFVAPLWADPVVVSGGPELDYESSILELDSGGLMIVFDRMSASGGELYVTFSEDTGKTWSTPVMITNDPLHDQATPCLIKTLGEGIRMYYSSNETGLYDIYEARSTDGVDWTFVGPVYLGWTNSQPVDPTVVLEEDGSLTMSYYLLYTGNAYVAHTDDLDSWDTLRTFVRPGQRPRIMKHSNGTYLFSSQENVGGSYDWDIFVTTSIDRLEWTEPVRLTDNNNSHDSFGGELPDGSYLVYYAKVFGSQYELCRRSSWDAEVWAEEERITFNSTYDTQPHFIVHSSGDLCLVWAHQVSTNDYDVYFERLEIPPLVEEQRERARVRATRVSPNPFRKGTMIEVETSDGIPDFLVLYDGAGRRIRALSPRTVARGLYEVSWDGTDDSGVEKGPGVYFIPGLSFAAGRPLRLVRLP